jgi:phytoene desaturase
LAAAILLASTGLRVKVIERLSVVGGRTSAISAGGFKFDLGPTFFLFPRVLEEIFAAAGASSRSEVEMVRLDPHYRIVFGEGGQLDATAEVSRMEAQIAQLSLADAAGFGASSRRIGTSSDGWSRAWRLHSLVGATFSTSGF